MNMPVHYKGKTQNGWHRYYTERAFPGRDGAYTVHIERWRPLAWFEAWWTWVNLRITGDEV